MFAQTFDSFGVNPLLAWMFVVTVTMITYVIILQIKQHLRNRRVEAYRRRWWRTHHA